MRADRRKKLDFEFDQLPQPSAAKLGIKSVAEDPVPLAEGAKDRVAIVVAHGMGQQVEFETLDQVVSGLEHAGGDWKRTAPLRPRNVRIGGESLRRVETRFEHKDGGRREVHLYEAYWAPATEGRVKIADVAAFVAAGGMNGVVNGGGVFRRWIFDAEVVFGRRPGTTATLLLALAALAALATMNLIAGAVLVGKPWMADALAHALAEALVVVFAAVIVVVASLWAARAARKPVLAALREGKTPAVAGIPTSGMRVFALALGLTGAYLVATASILVAGAWRGEGVGPGARLAVGGALALALAHAFAWSARGSVRASEAQAETQEERPAGLANARSKATAAIVLTGLALAALVAIALMATLPPSRPILPLEADSMTWAGLVASVVSVLVAIGAAVASGRAQQDAAQLVFDGEKERPREHPKESRYKGLGGWAAAGSVLGLFAMTAGAFHVRAVLDSYVVAWGVSSDLRIGASLAAILLAATALALVAAVGRGFFKVAWRALVLAALLAIGFVVGAYATPDPLRGVALVAWGVVAGVAVLAGRFLVQYVGDVAAYVSPHTLDRFEELRKEIKRRAKVVFDAVYSAGETRDGKTAFAYEKVLVVGHSLGSVVVYDALNGCLVQDELARRPDPSVEAPADAKLKWRAVAQRTKLLLTFGSPLDRTAFVFATQRASTVETREALAMIVQPMAHRLDVRARIPWVNVWARGDILGSELSFYDAPALPPDHRVKNMEDELATTPLASHSELWENALVWEQVKARL